MPLNTQQRTAIEAGLMKTHHMLVSAKAGTGKTTLLRTLAERVLEKNKNASIIYLAFNTRIKNEASKKLPQAVTVETCNSRGMKTVRSIQRNVKMDQYKSNRIAREFVDAMELYDMPVADMKEKVSRLAKLANLVRLTLNRDVLGLADRYGIELHEGEDQEVIELVRLITNDTKTIDFVDQIYRPAVFDQYHFEKFDYVMVDECQDLSVAQQRFIQKLVKPGGIMVFVGDPRQAIYGFAGADAMSFERLKEIEGIKEYPLNQCYRCDRNIIKLANEIDPDIKAWDGAGEGVVDRKAKVSDIRDGDLVVCRNTLPLVTLCYKLIGEGRKAFVMGRNIASTLINFIDKSKARGAQQLFSWMDQQPARLLAQLQKLYPQATPEDLQEKRVYIDLQERVKIIKYIAVKDSANTTAQIKAAIDRIFNGPEEGVALGTIHRVKGEEYPRVLMLDPDLLPSKWAKQPWQLVQEDNLAYVAYTRAQNYFGFISDWSGQDQANEMIPDAITTAVPPRPDMKVNDLSTLF
jgi:superfamily I DNA/RNA helicase